jgi:hypothetical protein
MRQREDHVHIGNIPAVPFHDLGATSHARWSGTFRNGGSGTN